MGSVIKGKVCDALSMGQDALALVEKSREVIPVVSFLILSHILSVWRSSIGEALTFVSLERTIKSWLDVKLPQQIKIKNMYI